MEYVSVIAAAIAAYVFGAVWYMVMAKPWMAASGVEVGEDGRPAGANDPVPYIVALVCLILVAGMMRHIFALSGIDSLSKGATSGFGIGLFLATPWLATCYGFSDRPRKLTLIDGTYATVGCTIIGIVLTVI